MRHPIITLTTDFGLTDHYVGAMKGVILSICPAARIVDICHQVTPYEIAEAAYVLAEAWQSFPKGTVHVVVIDPGVGTARRPILAEAAGHFFVAPDNGVLGMIWLRQKHKVREIVNARYFHKPVSRTFHGRDIFAPVAAHIAKGVQPARMGKLIQDYLRPSFEAPQQTGKHFWTGMILKIDHFGNAITNFRLADFPAVERAPFELLLGPHAITRLAHNYAECGAGELFVIEGSSGYLEISMSQAPAAKALGCAAGAPVELRV
jgi:S-adenosyl-L-methionine hydrolase (adenosine-forming)